MPENNIEVLKNQMEEVSLDLVKSLEELDRMIEEQNTRAKQNVIKSQTDFLEKTQILTDIRQPQTVEEKDLEEETKHVLQVLKEQKNAVFEANLQKMNLSLEKKEEQVVENSIKDTSNIESTIISTAKDSVAIYDTEKILEKNLANYELQAIDQEELKEQEEIMKKPSIEELNQVIEEIERENQENSIKKDSSNKKTTKTYIGEVKTDLEVSKSKSIKPSAKVKNKRKKKNPEWDQSLAYFKCALGASALIGMIAVPVIGEILNHLPPKDKVGVESEFSLDESDKEAKSNALNEYQNEIFGPNTHDASGKTEAAYYYDLIDINLETKEKYEDPIVGFYLAYSSTSDWYKNNAESMGNFIFKYNYIYQTNYKNLEDFLQKNNFQSLAELESYALSTLQEKEEGKSL